MPLVLLCTIGYLMDHGQSKSFQTKLHSILQKMPCKPPTLEIMHFGNSLTEDDFDVEAVKQYPIRKYLANSKLPAFMTMPFRISLQALTAYPWSITPWPAYRELRKPPGTRSFTKVIRLDTLMLLEYAKKYLDGFSHIPIEWHGDAIGRPKGNSPALHLPSPGSLKFDDNDIKFLSNICNEDDYAYLMKNYVLGTVTEAIRTIEGLPACTPLANMLYFRNGNHLCTAHHARWEIFVLPKDQFNDVPMAFIFIPPSEFGFNDFMDLTAEQEFENEFLDKLDGEKRAPADVIWGVIHDVCKDRGYRFVVCNYVRWAFGIINQNFTEAHITTPIEANILDFDGSTNRIQSEPCNVIELLVFWINLARGRIPDPPK